MTKSKTINLKIQETEDGLTIEMKIEGFDPMTAVGLLELQKTEILTDLIDKQRKSEKLKTNFTPNTQA